MQVNNLIFSTDFYVLEMEENKLNTTQLILGRPFIKTARTKIDVFGWSLTMEFEDDVISFNIGENSSSQGIEVPIEGTHVLMEVMAPAYKDPLIKAMTMTSHEDLNKVGGYGKQNVPLGHAHFHRPYFDQMVEKNIVNGRLNCLRCTVEEVPPPCHAT